MNDEVSKEIKRRWESEQFGAFDGLGSAAGSSIFLSLRLFCCFVVGAVFLQFPNPEVGGSHCGFALRTSTGLLVRFGPDETFVHSGPLVVDEVPDAFCDILDPDPSLS